MKHLQSVKPAFIDLNELGARLNLAFSSRLVLRDKIIALDERKKSVMVVEMRDDAAPSVINLGEIASISIRKTYGSIGPGELKTKNIEQFLDRIDLHFAFRNGDDTIILPFYEKDHDLPRDRAKMHRNAKTWQLILSRIIDADKTKSLIDRQGTALINRSLAALSYK